MKKFKELNKIQKIFAILLLVLIGSMFVLGFDYIFDESNWESKISCKDGTEYIFEGRLSAEELNFKIQQLCEDTKYDFGLPFNTSYNFYD